MVLDLSVKKVSLYHLHLYSSQTKSLKTPWEARLQPSYNPSAIRNQWHPGNQCLVNLCQWLCPVALLITKGHDDLVLWEVAIKAPLSPE